MPGVEGSVEPAQTSDTLSHIPAESASWNKHPEAYQHRNQHHNNHDHHHHNHHESVSTSASDSANSSPTTTVSTVDDSSATEMSPGTSPESPMAKPFLSSFTVTQQPRPKTSDNETLQSSALLADSHRPTTPGRRPRNLKNLAVNTSGTLHMARAASTTSLPVSTSLKDTSDMDIASRSFSKPPSPPKRRPTNLGLTILTPASTKPLPQSIRVAVPPTPSFARPNMLRHFQSSPSLPIHTSSKVIDSAATMLAEQTSSFQKMSLSPPIKTDDSEPNFDIPLSKEEKPEAYPDGPISVYGPHLDLYLEPTAQQALEYDVIMNVASEVRNPFDKATNESSPGPELRLDGGGGIQYAPRRSFHGALKSMAQRDALSPVIESSPTTPKAPSPVFDPIEGADARTGSGPEYIHVPWEHNTDIVPDLLRLVKVTDDRINAGKRVLIHCQCGVSRSATLVVAYVIYKNPSMSVQEAYDAVKRKSKWIGPNMNLIMQLQEFRTALMRPTASRLNGPRGLSPISPSLPVSEWGRPGPHADNFADGETPPNTAPLPVHKRLSAALASNGELTAVSPGPSSAPSGFAWPSHDESVPAASREGPLKSQDSAYVDPSGHVVPVVKIIEEPQSATLKPPRLTKDRPHSLNLDTHSRHDSGRHVPPALSPRLAEFAMGPLQPSDALDSADTFGLLSPTATEFPHSPLDRDALLGTLGMGPAIQQSTRPQQLLPKSDQQSSSAKHDTPSTLKPKLSAPSLREQRELQAMQLQLEASLAQQASAGNVDPSDMEALMSPRAFEFTQNPFALAVQDAKAAAAIPEGGDPRSPAHKGVSPITRNIFDVL